VEELDWSTGQILDKLVELGIDKRTLVIWTSDNGAPLAADVKSTERGSNLPLHGRGYTTAEGAFRIPTIMWQPGTVPARTVCEEMATTMDLLPTFARMAGGEPPAERKIDGKDIRPLIFAERAAKSTYESFYFYQEDQLQAVRSGPWKLFLPLDGWTRHPHFEKPEDSRPLLFNVSEYVGSTRDVSQEYPGVVQQLMKMAEEARRELGDRGRQGEGQRPPGRVESPAARVLGR
jgi:arylsulfatase A-like enzyme